MTEDGKFVMPGEAIGISEEFMPGSWAYEEEGGIYSAVTGNVKVDMKDRMIDVIPKVSAIPLVRDGDIVMGRIWDVRSQLALIDIIKIKGVDRGLPGNSKGAVHISKVREGYSADITKEFSVGDVILAKVVEADREPMELTTAGKTLGVVNARCPRCGGSMELFKDGLRCIDCKKVESRKVSSEYGTGEV